MKRRELREDVEDMMSAAWELVEALECKRPLPRQEYDMAMELHHSLGCLWHSTFTSKEWKQLEADANAEFMERGVDARGSRMTVTVTSP
jgi:hypothetical protein